MSSRVIERTAGDRPVPLPSAKLTLRGVSRDYRNARGEPIRAVNDVTFEVEKGEFVCLIGPSGCGKSTVLNMLAGLDRPDRGEILMDGRPIVEPGPERGMLFQEPALFPWMTVIGNVEFALKLQGVAGSERTDRAMDWLKRVHLTRFAGAQPHELSGGMRQRVALARTLACRPEVILADEPFAALDAQTREILQNELQEMWLETKPTLVFVTHNVREAVFLADRVLLMSAPPGTLMEEQRIEAPRPRDFEDVLLSKVVVDIHEHLRKEVEKVVAREIGAR